MADCGDLEKLPPEIRNEIYALVLVKAGPLTLCNFGGDQKKIGAKSGRGSHAPKMNNEWARSDKAKVAPVGHKRRRKGIGHIHVGSRWFEVPSNVALLCVNRKIYWEAAPVLYYRTKFRFRNASTMRRFLNLIGDNIEYLRGVGISCGGWDTAVLCTKPATHLKRWLLQKAFVPSRSLCTTPLLDSSKTAYESGDLNASILEVIKIESVEPLSSLFKVYRRKAQTTEDRIKRKLERKREHERRVTEHQREVDKHHNLQRELKRLVAEQHKLAFES